MKKIINIAFVAIASLAILSSCKKDSYEMGALTSPTDFTITAEIVGQDASNPNGDGSGKVIFHLSAKDALSYKIDFDNNDPEDLKYADKGVISKTYGTNGVNTYTVTAVAYGAGATSTTTTLDVTVRTDFTPDPSIITALTGGSSKTWKVDKTNAGHFGVGPWDPTVTTPIWWAAAPNEKEACCPCFYTARFTFNKVGSNQFSIDVNTPDGAFTKTGSLTNLPGIPGSGGEDCYSYSGGSGSFSFAAATSGVASTAPTTGVSIILGSSSTFIEYGSLQNEYEIMTIDNDHMYLRAQGTETGNAWYLKLIPQ